MTKITVTIRKIDEWYIATSPDLKGLVVCHPNLTEFTQEIPACIAALFRANHNREVEVQEL
jgi:hypothetical protein